MLKGKMTIELTDVNTGEKETIEEENMVTNALSEIFRPLGHLMNADSIYNNNNMYYQKFLGGLLLFDNPIEEDANQLFAPANTNLVGCAVYNTQNNTTGKMRGGYNQTESEFNAKQRYMKFVYDFSTSQANGTISCVALTHQQGGYTSYGSSDAVLQSQSMVIAPFSSTLHYVYPSCTGASTGDQYSGCTIGTTELLFLLDTDNDMAYYFKIKSANTISIVRRRMYLKSVSIFENPYSQKALIDETELDQLSIPMSTAYISFNFDTKNNYLYICSSANYYTAPNGTYQITRIRLRDYAISQWTMTNTANENINTNGMRFAFCYDGFVYLRGYNSPYETYKVEIGNSANITKIKRSGMSSNDCTPIFAINGRIYYQLFGNSPHLYILNTETDEMLKTENYCVYTTGNAPAHTPVLNHPLHMYCSYGGWSTGPFFIVANYLGTINNLSEPVTKTADKTMKITYTIQEQ